MPKAKATKKDKVTGDVPVTSSEDLGTKPSMNLPDLGAEHTVGSDGVPDLGADPSVPEVGDGNTFQLPSIPDVDVPELPDLESLTKDYAAMAGKTPGAATSSLAEEFLPILSERVDQLAESLRSEFQQLKEALFHELGLHINPLVGDVQVVKKLTAQAFEAQASAANVLSTLTENVNNVVSGLGMLLKGQQSVGEANPQVFEEEASETPSAAQEGVVQEAAPPAPEEKREPVISDRAKSLIQSYGQAFKGSPIPTAGFLQAIFKKHASELDPSYDSLESFTAYLGFLGVLHGDGNQVVFPAK